MTGSSPPSIAPYPHIPFPFFYLPHDGVGRSSKALRAELLLMDSPPPCSSFLLPGAAAPSGKPVDISGVPAIVRPLGREAALGPALARPFRFSAQSVGPMFAVIRT